MQVASDALFSEATKLVLECFGSNLVFAFIGGSHAQGLAGPRSDVDVFALLERACAAQENTFADQFATFSREHRIEMDHLGEIFSVQSLTSLMNFTERAVGAFPGMLHLGCYHGDCALSIFRKGDIVMKMLADPKVVLTGSPATLAAFERRARAYFALTGTTRRQAEIGRVSPSDANARALLVYFEGLVSRGGVRDTPAGVGLDRWFANVRLPVNRGSQDSAISRLAWRRSCGLDVPLGSDARSVVEGQCLASHFTLHEESPGPDVSRQHVVTKARRGSVVCK